MEIGKDPIHTDVAAERAVISGILKYNFDGLIKADDAYLKKEDFYYESNGEIFRVAKEYLDENPNGKIDRQIIEKRIKESGSDRVLKIIQKEGLVDILKEASVNIDSIYELAFSVKKCSIFRHVVDSLEDAKNSVEEAMTPKLGLEDLLCLVENKLGLVTEHIANPNAKFLTFADGYDEWLDELINNPKDYAGVPTGFPLYDASIGRGLRRGSVSLLGARTGVGKSMLSINVGNNIVDFGIPTLYIDTELIKEHQFSRLAAARTGIGIYEIETGKFSKDPAKKKKMIEEAKKLQEKPFYHQYVGGWRFEEILAYMKKWVRKCVGVNEDGTTKPCVIIFDYMKMMRSDGLESMKEYQMIGFWMTMLHDFAIRYDVPLMLLIQLNRDGISNEGQGVAAQSDRTEWLASSFTILKRKDQDEIMETGEFGNAKLIVVKSRFGPCTPAGDYINLYYDGSKANMKEGKMASQVRKESYQKEKDENGKEED